MSTRFPDDVYDERFDRSAATKKGYLSSHLPEDLSGESVLDVGCCTGLFSLLALERGAAHVVGIDDNPGYIKKANYLICDALEVDNFEAKEASVYTFQPDYKFDHVIFYGTLYHLLDPFYGLFRIWSLVAGSLYLHTYFSTKVGDDYLSELVYTPHLQAYNNWLHGINVIRTMLDYIGFDIQQEEMDGNHVFLIATLRDEDIPFKYRWASMEAPA